MYYYLLSCCTLAFHKFSEKGVVSGDITMSTILICVVICYDLEIPH